MARAGLVWLAEATGDSEAVARAFAARLGAMIRTTACVLRPESRGEIRLRSTDPAAHPVVDPRYLSAPEDMRLVRFCFAKREETLRLAAEKLCAV